jgi:hypothetical protein
MNWVPITAQVVSRIPTHNRGYLIHLYVKNLAVTNCGKFYALQFPSTIKKPTTIIYITETLLKVELNSNKTVIPAFTFHLKISTLTSLA